MHGIVVCLCIMLISNVREVTLFVVAERNIDSDALIVVLRASALFL